MYTFIDTERLIDEVRCRRCLWDSAHEMYKIRDAKNQAWDEIGEAMFGDSYKSNREIEKSIRQRWKSARDGYFKTKASMRNTASGSAAKKIRKYIFYDQLMFLDQTCENGVSESLNISTPQLDADESCSSQNTTFSLYEQHNTQEDRDTPLWSRKRKNAEGTECSQFEKEMIHLLKKYSPDLSPDDMAFFSSLSPVLKKFNSHHKLLFRSKVLQIAMDLSSPLSSEQGDSRVKPSDSDSD